MALININGQNISYDVYNASTTGNKCPICKKEIKIGKKIFFGGGHFCSLGHMKKGLQARYPKK